jgi:hypothetical protein
MRVRSDNDVDDVLPRRREDRGATLRDRCIDATRMFRNVVKPAILYITACVALA